MAYNKVFITRERYEFFLQTGVNYEGFGIGVGYAYTFAITKDSLFMTTVSSPKDRYALSHYEIWNTPRIDTSPDSIARSYGFSLSEIEQIIQKRTVNELQQLFNLNLSYQDEWILQTDKEAIKAVSMSEQNKKQTITLCITDIKERNARYFREILLSDLLVYLHKQAVEEGKVTANGKPIVFVQRLAESPNATVSFFMVYGKDHEIVSGFFLEPGGPSTAKRNQDKRIPAGVHSVSPRESPNHGKVYSVHSNIVPANRDILIHSGNTHLNTEGCFLPGEAYVLENGDYSIKGGTSKNKLNQLRAILGKGDAIMIIKEIP